MFILLNGAFGVGKTTVARELRRLLGGALFDPEKIGLILQRLPGSARSDFQHFPSWRRLTIAGAKIVHALRRPVIIPMAFSDLNYLDEVRTGLAATGSPVMHFCLIAPLDVVHDRLARRGDTNEWPFRRAEECCAAHADAAFGVHIDTVDRSPASIAADIAARVRMYPLDHAVQESGATPQVR